MPRVHALRFGLGSFANAATAAVFHILATSPSVQEPAQPQPLVAAGAGMDGRGVSRGFALLDHEEVREAPGAGELPRARYFGK